MSRNEFNAATKRQARDRSGGRCEAVGEWYGLSAGIRCINKATEFDHDRTDKECRDLGVISTALDNCVALCRQCHAFKTKRDVRRIRKANRQKDKATGVRRRSSNRLRRPDGFIWDWQMGKYVRE